MPTARFRVDPRLASLLGESYRSSEEALRELVDNAWDADAEEVRISVPGAMKTAPIVVQDDGSGMTEREVRDAYLYVANGRRTRSGDRTPRRKRLVKGRKGIGKFAGLIAADVMLLETRANGRATRLEITKKHLLEAGGKNPDIENIDLPLVARACGPEEHGTTVTLSSLAQSLEFPDPTKLRELLVLEYGRDDTFRVFVNGERVAIVDVPGERFAQNASLASAGAVTLKLTVSDDRKPSKQAGIAIRVGGKIVGRPSLLGLDDDESIPSRLARRIYGEVEADGLMDSVTADWGGFIENSKAFQEVRSWAADKVRAQLAQTFTKEVSAQEARVRPRLQPKLELIPEARRAAAEAGIKRVLQKFYGENDDKIELVASLMLEAFERDEYWLILQKIDEATRSDVAKLADILDEFGLVDLATIGHQAKGRLRFLDELELLIKNQGTLEAQVHRAIERNLWVLGSEFALVSSNKTLQTLTTQWLDKKYTGRNAKKRPDLLLANSVQRRHVIIEFKRPSYSIDREDEAQAQGYRDDLVPVLGGPVEVVLVGGKRDPTIPAGYDPKELSVKSYWDLAASARSQLTWLLQEMGGTSASAALTGK